MRIIICIALVAVAFFIGWNAAQMRWINKIGDILDILNREIKTCGELNSEDRSFVRGVLKTISLLQGWKGE